MCAFQFNFSSMCTPRYIADSWMAIFLLFIMMDLGGFLLFDHRTTWVLRVLISSPLELHHSTKNFPTSTQSLGLSRGVGHSHLDAFKTVYSEFKLRLCFFHLCQSVQKNIFKKFKKQYKADRKFARAIR